MQRQALAVDLHRHRIDQERHVVVDDLDHRVAGLPAVFFQARIGHAQLGRAGAETAQKIPVRQRRPVQVLHIALAQVVGIDLRIVFLRETHDGRRILPRAAFFDQCADLADQLRLGFFAVARHARHPIVFTGCPEPVRHVSA